MSTFFITRILMMLTKLLGKTVRKWLNKRREKKKNTEIPLTTTAFELELQIAPLRLNSRNKDSPGRKIYVMSTVPAGHPS